MSVTSMEGECVYCPLPDDTEAGVPSGGVRPRPRQLLSRPILGLLEEVEREEFQRAVRITEGGALAQKVHAHKHSCKQMLGCISASI